jgi:aspartyl-tRNA(Asn)/glutamyl-tRNA(Gln) amidotransferase subunit B
MRTKEFAHDYRYFPDPDLLPIAVDDKWIAEIQASVTELPAARKARFVSTYGLPPYDAELLTSRKDVADYFEFALRSHSNSKAISNWILSDLFRALRERKLDERLYISDWPVAPQALAELVRLIDEGKISGRIAKTLFSEMLVSGRLPHEIVSQQGLEQVSDSAIIETAIEQVLAAHPKQVVDYRGGNERVFGFFVGQVMKATQGKANPQRATEILRRKLTKEI